MSDRPGQAFSLNSAPDSNGRHPSLALFRRALLWAPPILMAVLLVGGAAGCADTGPGDPPEPAVEPEEDGGSEPDVAVDGGFDAGTNEPDAEPSPASPAVEPEAEPEPDDAGPGDGGVDDDAGPPECGSGCGGGLACCDGVCIDLSASPAHCGACGNACSLDEFCGGEPLGCHPALFQNLCLVNRPYRIDDTEAADVASGAIIAEAVESACPQMEQMVERAQDDPSVVDISNGRPITGVNSLAILAGGSFFHQSVRYLEAAADLPVISETTANTERLHRRNGGTIVDIPKAAVTPGHDFFVIQVADEAISGTLVLTAYGMFTPGTRAAAYWLANEILPNLDTITDQYFIYEWTDGNGDEIPNAGDAFDLVYSG